MSSVFQGNIKMMGLGDLETGGWNGFRDLEKWTCFTVFQRELGYISTEICWCCKNSNVHIWRLNSHHAAL
jgi:hypothetical protein